MITFEQYKEVIGRHAVGRTEEELRQMYKTDTTLFAFVYKKWDGEKGRFMSPEEQEEYYKKAE